MKTVKKSVVLKRVRLENGNTIFLSEFMRKYRVIVSRPDLPPEIYANMNKTEAEKMFNEILQNDLCDILEG
uniref:Uncharacterized protein n=1 Tax=viral metagenome TaxID=1070528 RepID=A0A6H1ZSH6_9ZZZZ